MNDTQPNYDADAAATNALNTYIYSKNSDELGTQNLGFRVLEVEQDYPSFFPNFFPSLTSKSVAIRLSSLFAVIRELVIRE